MTESIDKIIETLMFVGERAIGATSEMLDKNGLLFSAENLHQENYLEKVKNGSNWYSLSQKGCKLYNSITEFTDKLYSKK